jgi:hypothetical protein
VPEVQLTEKEDKRVDATFMKYDSLKMGEIDLSKFNSMCEEMELPLDFQIAQEWLGGRNKEKGIKLEEFKQLYGKILSAQGPAVRAAASGKELRFPLVRSSEAEMRGIFAKMAVGGQISIRTLCTALQLLNFPDHYGDGFDRFVTEWATLEGCVKGPVDYHGFVSCVNLLVDFCEQERVGRLAR